MPLDQDIAHFDLRLAEIEQKLVELHIERTEITRLRLASLAARAPWRRLPAEMMSDIFVKLLDDGMDLHRYRLNAAYAVPTIVSLVSSEWRALALSTPRLWSKIGIINERGSRTLPIWLERSRLSPITFTCQFDKISNASLRYVFGEVRNHIHHIVDLDIEINTNALCDKVIGALDLPAPILHTLRIQCDGYDWVIPDELSRKFLGGSCPNLRSLKTELPYLSWPTDLVKNLTTLVFSSFVNSNLDGSYMLHHIERVPNVSDLTLETCGYQYAPNGVILKPVTLWAITHLSIRGHFREVFGLLSCLRLPNIRSLTLTSDRWDEDPATWLLPNVVAMFPLLECFKLAAIKSDSDFDQVVADHLPHILRWCVNLKELHLENTIAPVTTLVKRFVLDGEDQPMCPHLTHLCLERSSGSWSAYDFKRVHQFLSSRINPEGTPMAQLQALSFVGCPPQCSFIERAVSFRPLVAKSVRYNGVELRDNITAP